VSHKLLLHVATVSVNESRRHAVTSVVPYQSIAVRHMLETTCNMGYVCDIMDHAVGTGDYFELTACLTLVQVRDSQIRII